jgi:hypothetical protein
MALAAQLSTAAANAAADAVTALLNGGFLRLYDGTIPATADTALSGNTLLAQLALANPAFAAAVAGAASANAITADSDADATGTATFFRAVTSGGATILQGTVGTSDANLNIGSVDIVLHATVTVPGLTYSQLLTGCP